MVFSPDGDRIGWNLMCGRDTIVGRSPFPILKYCLEQGYTIRIHYALQNHQRRRYLLALPWESYGTVRLDFQCPRIEFPVRADVARHHALLLSAIDTACARSGVHIRYR
jgi:hypothetical protein